MSSTENFSIYEEKLRTFGHYEHDSIQNWATQLDLENETINKIVDNLKIVTPQEIVKLLDEIVASNLLLFENPMTYITSFGGKGKSGDMMVYIFKHAFKKYNSKIIETTEVSELESDSNIIFLDDFIGTGNQACEYINGDLNLYLNSRCEAYLLSLFGTPEGIESVNKNTNFTVIFGQSLSQQEYQFYNDECHIFEVEEKQKIEIINKKLRSKSNYDQGLLIAFHYSVPNNTMPIIWKDKSKYTDHLGNEKEWFALLPRNIRR